MDPVLLCLGSGLVITIGCLAIAGYWQIKPPGWWPK